MTASTRPAVKRLNADIPVTMHKDFQIACIRNEEDMTAVLTAFIASYVKLTNRKDKSE